MRLHPQDLRAKIAAGLFTKGIYQDAFGGPGYTLTIQGSVVLADKLLAELGRTAPKADPAELTAFAMERIDWWTGRCAEWQARAEAAVARLAETRATIRDYFEAAGFNDVPNLMAEFYGEGFARGLGKEVQERVIAINEQRVKALAEVERLAKAWANEAHLGAGIESARIVLLRKVADLEFILAQIDASKAGEQKCPEWEGTEDAVRLYKWGKDGWDAAAALRVELAQAKAMLHNKNVELAQAREDGRIEGYRSALNDKSNGELAAVIAPELARARMEELDRCVEAILTGSQFFLAGIEPEMREAVVRRALASTPDRSTFACHEDYIASLK